MLQKGQVLRGRACTLAGADVLVNNAGLLLDEAGDVLEVDVQHFRYCMETNACGPLRLTQAFMPGMISRGYGRVVNVSSEAGQISSMTDYAPRSRFIVLLIARGRS